MTIIVAIPTKDGVFIGADSQVTRGDSILAATVKIITKQCADHEVLIAATGNHGLSSLARHGLTLPDAPDPADADGCDGWAYAVACALAELAAEAKPPVLDDGHVDGEALLAFDSHLWLLNGQCALRLTEPFAIGSGAPEARGALHVVAHMLPSDAPDAEPGWAIVAAVRAAIDLDPNCGGKIQIARTFSINAEQDR